MDDVIRFLFGQYSGYQTTDIVLEITAVVTSIISVFFSKKNNILVFPFGIVSTAIFVYLLYKWGLIGDLIINA
jgi:nicotinamide mononucleotide transporter